MKKIFIILTVLIFFTSCKQREEIIKPKKEISLKMSKEDYPSIDGSTATMPLAINLRAAITGEDIEQLKLITEHSKTSDSYYSILNGNTDLLIAYTPSDEIFQNENFDQLLMEPIGKDALVFFTNKDNKVSNLSLAQVQDIYQGKITNWNEVGGDDGDINPYQRNASSGSQVMMDKLIMNGLEMMSPEVKYIQRVMEGIIEEVVSYQNNENALGYSVYYYLKEFIDNGTAIKTISIDSVEVTNDNIANGSYKYTEDFYVVIRKDTPEDSNTKKIFDFLISDEGKQLIEESGYISVK